MSPLQYQKDDYFDCLTKIVKLVREYGKKGREKKTEEKWERKEAEWEKDEKY